MLNKMMQLLNNHKLFVVDYQASVATTDY